MYILMSLWMARTPRADMIVAITVTPPNAFSPQLAPSIAQLGHDELFLIELQGTLDVQCPEWTAKDGQLIGTLNTADMVRTHAGLMPRLC